MRNLCALFIILFMGCSTIVDKPLSSPTFDYDIVGEFNYYTRPQVIEIDRIDGRVLELNLRRSVELFNTTDREVTVHVLCNFSKDTKLLHTEKTKYVLKKNTSRLLTISKRYRDYSLNGYSVTCSVSEK